VDIGFLGTGRISAALVEGLGAEAGQILLSPRNEETAKRLAAKFHNVRVAADNQAVVDGSRIVFIALRQEHVSALDGLRFRPDHLVITLMGTVAHGTIAKIVRPATRVFRAGLTPAAAKRLGPIPYFPEDAEIRALLSRVGEPIPVAGEHEFHILWCAVSLIATQYALLETAVDWAAAHGVPESRARAFMAAQFRALAGQGEDFAALRREAATPGGLNEQALAAFRDAGGLQALRGAMDAAWKRLAPLTE